MPLQPNELETALMEAEVRLKTLSETVQAAVLLERAWLRQKVTALMQARGLAGDDLPIWAALPEATTT